MKKIIRNIVALPFALVGVTIGFAARLIRFIVVKFFGAILWAATTEAEKEKLRAKLDQGRPVKNPYQSFTTKYPRGLNHNPRPNPAAVDKAEEMLQAYAKETAGVYGAKK